MLGAKRGALSQILFLLIGLSGVPVFVHGGGPAYVLQPTFGYLLGFPVAAAWIGFMAHRRQGMRSVRDLLWIHGAGMAIIHALGVGILFLNMNLIVHARLSFVKALVAGSLIFLPAEILKIAASAALAVRLRHFRYIPTVLVAIGLLAGGAAGLEAQGRSSLVKVKQEIRQLEKELAAKETRERSVLENLEDIDRTLGLQQKLLAELEQERKTIESTLSETERDLSEAIVTLGKQRDLVVHRFVFLYKHGRMTDWAALFSMESMNQMLVWLKYQQRILENDRRNLRLFSEKELQVRNQKALVERQLLYKETLIRESQNEARRVQANRESRKKMLNQVRRDKKSILEQLEEKRRAFARIEGWIAQQELRRQQDSRIKTTRTSPVPPSARSAAARFQWPVQGRIVSRYGRQMDPSTKTWTENLGVDILAKDREKVTAASQGDVKYVTWLRGMGNLVLLDHGGLYTVYGHLDAVYVNSGETVEQGKPIGEVGDRYSLYGSMLHFEVWMGTTHHNPELWLR
jgi:septal ring factor EnvC (AmiA/AmiB activator)